MKITSGYTCAGCGNRTAIWAWQPFGPDENRTSCTALGSHYRGFPVVKICDECKNKMEKAVNEPSKEPQFHFKFNKTPMYITGNRTDESPF